MDQPRTLSKDEILVVLEDTFASIQPDVANVNLDTQLLGNEADIDSVGFVSLLVTLEQRLPVQVDLATSFMETQDGDDSVNPFKSIGSLMNHIHSLSQQQSSGG